MRATQKNMILFIALLAFISGAAIIAGYPAWAMPDFMRPLAKAEKRGSASGETETTLWNGGPVDVLDLRTGRTVSLTPGQKAIVGPTGMSLVPVQSDSISSAALNITGYPTQPANLKRGAGAIAKIAEVNT